MGNYIGPQCKPDHSMFFKFSFISTIFQSVSFLSAAYYSLAQLVRYFLRLLNNSYYRRTTQLLGFDDDEGGGRCPLGKSRERTNWTLTLEEGKHCTKLTTLLPQVNGFHWVILQCVL